ncbi:MAG: hypothetical protein RL325_166, partial [Planctomycetota bacterium]
YRVHLFNCLAEALERRGYELHVHFFGANNPDRPASWKRSLDDARFSHQVWDGYAIRVRGSTLWLNPRLVLHVARRSPDILLHGGIWDSFTSLLSVLLARPRKRVSWLEFNVDIPGRSRGISGRVKRWLLQRSNRLLVPGSKGLHYLERYMGDDLLKRAIVMPNIVDETRFRTPVTQEEIRKAREALGLHGEPGRELVLIWPARLIGHKGILEFLRHVDKETLAGYAIRIIGEGPLRAEILEEIARRDLGGNIELVGGYIDYTLMPAVYRAGDALLLPSLHDPNPLSIVEALHSGMPLLVSDRIGNFSEAMVHGENGYGFDPMDGDAVRDALASFRALSPEDRARMGARSADLASTAWCSRACVERAVEGMLAG